MSDARRPPPSAELPAKKTRAEAATLRDGDLDADPQPDADEFEGLEDFREEAAVAAFADLLDVVYAELGVGPPPPMVPMVFHAAFLPPPPPHLSHASVEDAMRYAKCSVDRYRMPALEQLTAMADAGHYHEKTAALKRMVENDVVLVITLYLSSDHDDNHQLQRSALELLLAIAVSATDSFAASAWKALCDLELLKGALRLACHAGAADIAAHALAALRHIFTAILVYDGACAIALQKWAIADGGILPALVKSAVDPSTPMGVAMAAATSLHCLWCYGCDIDAATPVLPLLKKAVQHREHVLDAMRAIAVISRMEGGALGRYFGTDLLVVHGIVGDVASIMAANPEFAVKLNAFSALTAVCKASHAHKWHVARSGVLNALPAALAPDSVVSKSATCALHALIANEDNETLRYLLKEVPDAVPTLIRGMKEPKCRTRNERLGCLKDMVRAAGPEERGQLAAAGALEALIASKT